MQYVEPQAYMLAATGIMNDNVGLFLEELGAKGWSTDAKSGSEAIMEIAGRLCYKSFGTELNANVTRTREGNQNYLQNGVIKALHGSVLEHGVVTFAMLNVSRIVTHELVRHRAGMAYSQESLRFVRLDDLGMYKPAVFSEEYLRILADYAIPSVPAPEAKEAWAKERSEILTAFLKRTTKTFEGEYKRVVELLGLDVEGMPFEHKKLVTSALRRMAPSGMATHIICTGNHRAWRHIIAMRTAPGAEEEIRHLFWDVAEILKDAFPAIYEDMFMHPETRVCEFRYEKV